MNALWTEDDGQRLRASRFAAGFSESLLAKLNALSLAQLRELENGGQGSFYSPAIKAQVGRKLLRSLGADARGVSGNLSQAAQAQQNEVTKAIAALELEKIAVQASQSLNSNFTQRFERSLMALSRAHRNLSVYVLVGLSFCLIVLSFPSLAPFFKAIYPTEITSSTQGSVPIEPNIAVTQAPQATIPLPQDNAQSTLAVATPIALTAPAIKSQANRDCDWQDEDTVIQSNHSEKSSDYVYLVAGSASAVCVLDARNQTTRLVLTSGEAKSVYGSAPWRLRSSDLATIKIFFQGQRISLPDTQTTQIKLHAYLSK